MLYHKHLKVAECSRSLLELEMMNTPARGNFNYHLNHFKSVGNYYEYEIIDDRKFSFCGTYRSRFKFYAE